MLGRGPRIAAPRRPPTIPLPDSAEGRGQPARPRTATPWPAREALRHAAHAPRCCPVIMLRKVTQHRCTARHQRSTQRIRIRQACGRSGLAGGRVRGGSEADAAEAPVCGAAHEDRADFSPRRAIEAAFSWWRPSRCLRWISSQLWRTATFSALLASCRLLWAARAEVRHAQAREAPDLSGRADHRLQR